MKRKAMHSCPHTKYKILVKIRNNNTEKKFNKDVEKYLRPY